MTTSRAATDAVLSARDYDRLRKDVGQILEQAHARAREAVAREAVAAYWRVGQRLAAARLTDRAAYRAAVLDRLATDLAIDRRTLERAEAFHRAYPKAPPTGVGWAHVRELLKLADPSARAHFAELTRTQHLTVRQLVAAVRAHLDAPRDAPTDTPAARAKLARPADATFLYRAEVLRVLDGDTLELRIDLGFHVFTQDKIRLAGIDAADTNTAGGDAATRYVQDTLAKARTVVVQTRKFDLHGRYVAHLFYTLEETPLADCFAKGRYLNQDLLAKDLAVPYEKAGTRRKR